VLRKRSQDKKFKLDEVAFSIRICSAIDIVTGNSKNVIFPTSDRQGIRSVIFQDASHVAVKIIPTRFNCAWVNLTRFPAKAAIGAENLIFGSDMPR
jgi:hypothetical protein